MRTVILKTALVGMIGTCSLSGLQHDLPAIKIVTEEKTPNRDRFYLGPDVFWADESPQIKNIQIKDKSVYYGLKIGYDFLKPGAIYAGGHAMYAIGQMHIKAEAEKTKLYNDKTKGTFANAELRLGYNFPATMPFFLTPFFGLGGYHVRPMKSINYVQDWIYAAVGMKADLELGSNFNIGMNVKGTQSVYLEQRVKSSKYSATYNKNTKALGYEVSIPLTFHAADTSYWDLRLEPYYLKLNSRSHANVVGGELNLSVKY